MDQREPFFMIYGLGQGVPTVRHDSFASAKNEAHRLARNCPGVKFYVLQAIACATKNDVDFRTISSPIDDDGLPF